MNSLMTPDCWKKVLVPTDFSDLSLSGVRAAAAWQHSTGMEVVLLHVTEPAHDGLRVQTADLHKRIDQEALECLYRLSAELFPNAKNITPLVLEGKAADSICKAATDHEVDAIIIPTHGRSGLKRALLGSVVEKVVRQAPCSVLVVRE